MILKKFRILLLFLFFFGLDKIILIPSVRNFLTEENIGNPYVESFKNISASYLEDPKYQDKKKIWAFGTSRSFIFYQFATSDYNHHSDFISENQKKSLDEYKFFGYAAPGSNPLIYYTRFNQLMDKQYKPDVVFLEVSAFSFNKKNRFYNITLLEGMPLEFAIQYFNELPSDFAKEYFFSRLFSLSRYKISTKTISTNLFGTKDKNAELLKNFMPSNQMSVDPFANAFDTKTNREELPYSPDSFNDFYLKPANDTDTYLKTVMLVDVLKNEFYGNYSLNEDNFVFLEKIIERCKKNKIPVVLWIPKVHKNLTNFYAASTFYPSWKSKIQSLANKTSTRFVDLNEEGKIRCDYFQDAAHLSGRCMPEINSVLLNLPK
ncbi:DUF1574 domain-containing protein [Leptospira meyeri]|uniref:DUF1574 family protein n=1 Tax=Leptospira meyeri TaxID=29508 RepID=UPI00108394B7|nr:DUF1574 family protein [Leptospira meyeri]TGL51125.1 DUF1574 domain-containing protein [Leptospira meyeri]